MPFSGQRSEQHHDLHILTKDQGDQMDNLRNRTLSELENEPLLEAALTTFANPTMDHSLISLRKQRSASPPPLNDTLVDLLAIFVVTFDTRFGNVIEWQEPAELDLRGVEFKAMASGFHLVSTDFV